MPELNEPLPLKDLEGLLQQTLPGPLTVQVNDWRHLTDPGENFGSLILAVNATVTRNGKQEARRLVCKMPPRSDYLLDLFNSPMTFKKELYFYQKIAPAFLQLQLDSGIGENELIQLVPHFYGGRMSLSGGSEGFDEQAAIVLENLNYSGYSMKDRLDGMDLEHMEFGVRELAKLHAITCGYRAKNPKDFAETIAPGLMPAPNDTAMKCVMEMIGKAVENLRQMDEVKPHVELIYKTLEHVQKHAKEPKSQIEHWRTFLHNDFWVNNMMFCYSNNNNIMGMKMVDFQLTDQDYGIKDLIFFLISSAKKDIIENKLNDLITLYYESFINTLRSLKVDTSIWTREEYDKLVKECAPLKFPQCIMMIQVIKAEKGSAPDVNNIKNEEDFLSLGKGKLYDEKLLHVFETFRKNGWLVN